MFFFPVAQCLLRNSYEGLMSIVRRHDVSRKDQTKERQKDFIDVYLEKVTAEETKLGNCEGARTLKERGTNSYLLRTVCRYYTLRFKMNFFHFQMLGMKCAVGALDDILVGGDGIWFTWHAALFLFGN